MNPASMTIQMTRAERDPEQQDLTRGGDTTEQERARPAERRRQDLAREPRAERDERGEDRHGSSIQCAGLRSCCLDDRPHCGGVATKAAEKRRS